MLSTVMTKYQIHTEGPEPTPSANPHVPTDHRILLAT